MKPIHIGLMLALIFHLPLAAIAELHPKGLNTDQRIQRVVYDANNVVKLTSHYGYQTDIVFSLGEEIQNIAVGDALSWQAVSVQNHVFIKPMAASNTNLTVLTNKRSYHFQLQSTNAHTATQVFKLEFMYPQESESLSGISGSSKSLSPLQVNWRYSFTGHQDLVPLQVFDDGEFTYLKFTKNGLARLPAFFRVREDRTEVLTNYHMEGEYAVIHHVAKQWTLRDGARVTCLYNDFAIGDWQKMERT